MDAARIRFDALQVRWQIAAEDLRAFRAKTARNAPFEVTLMTRENRAGEAFCAFLRTIQGRDFGYGFPLSFLRDSLSYDDAVTTGPMSVISFPSYGFTADQMAELSGKVTR